MSLPSASLRRLLAPAAFLAVVGGLHFAHVLSVTRAAWAEEEQAEEARPFERAPDPASTPGADADLYLEGVELQAKGQFKLARKKFWKLIDLYPNSPYRSEAEDRSGDRDGGNAFLGFTPMGPTGPSERRIDVALMGDGYLLEKQDVFEKHAVGELDLLLKEPTYAEYRAYFNFWRFNLASRDTGVDETPRVLDEEEQERENKRKKKKGPRQFDTAIDCKAAGPQGQVMANPVRVYHYLAYLDVNDSLVIAFAQKGVLGMGGGGIATTGPRGVVVHEFGHAFGWLLDEYANNPGPPSGQVSAANATTDKDRPPWQHFLDARVPKVGVFEGGATFQKGVFRPAPACAMNTGGGDPYCPVCREQVILTIYAYVSPIDEAAPADAEVVRPASGWPAFRVVPQTPTTHTLDVKWFLGPAPVVTPAADAPPDPTYEGSDDGLTPEERRLKKRQKQRADAPPEGSALPDLPDLPADDALPVPSLETPEEQGGLQDLRPKAIRQERRNAGTGKDAPPVGREIAAKKDKIDGGRTAWSPVLPDLPAGRYLLTAVVNDSTRLKGERFPWVLKDERGLLEDRRTWLLVVPEGKGK